MRAELRGLRGLPAGEGRRPDAPRRQRDGARPRAGACTTPASCSGGATRARRLWVVRRADIAVLEDPDLLDPPLDRSFKKPGGYVMRDKLAAARARAGTEKPAARADGPRSHRRPTREGELMSPTGGAPASRRRGCPRRRARATRSPSSCSRWPTTSSSAASPTPSGRASRRCSRRTSRSARSRRTSSGHARALYQLLADVLADGRDEDALAYDREPDEYRHARLLDHPRGDWADTIARRFLYELADEARLASIGPGYRPLADLVEKLRREERYHRMHVLAWIDRLASGGAEPRRRLEAALARPRASMRRRCSRRSTARPRCSRPGS